MADLIRPEPPDLPEGAFVAAPGLAEWARAAFLTEGGPFWTEEHAHLLEARIVWSWTSAEGRSRGRSVVGEAQLVERRGAQWSKLRDYDRVCGWWREMPDYVDGTDPDFLVTLYAPWAQAASDAGFGAVCDHELFHCGQAEDQWGLPRVSQATGRPAWKIVGHDVEEHVAVVRRWGTRALPDVERMVAAARKPPEIAEADITGACGTCRRAA